MVEQFLLTRHKSDILEIIRDEDEKKHYPVNINFVELFENDTALGNSIIKEDPEQAFCDLENEIFNAQEILIEQQSQKATLKMNIHARVYGLPLCPELHRTKFPRNADTDFFLQICGTVVRVTASKMLEYQRPYTCTKCKEIEMIEADYDFKYTITPPFKCGNCGGSKFISVGELNSDNCKDYQEIKIQEKASEVGVGSMPSALWVTLEDDLVDSCKPGDDVIICGFVKVRHGPLVVGKRIEAEIVLQANHILATNGYTSPKVITYDIKQKFILFWEKYKNKPIEGRDMILKSFCPKLYGMYIVKLAVAIVLTGGSRCKEGNETGIQLRSEPHLLLVGDPGTGKSQLLRYAAKVVPRAVLTTGIGTTSAGLTAAAMMEDGHWQLEGGALVLADGGVCCIDEFNSMKPHDRTSIHEAMEQQTISCAKVGRVCKLQTRCSILAATNPKGGRLDPSQQLSLNLTLPSPLLSRFDIVMMLRDCYDEEWDSLIADHILDGKGIEALTIGDVCWDLETLQHYFMVIKDIQPVLTEVTNKILGSYYQAQRRAETRNKARSTVRLLDSLIRLSQSHARFMCHSEVQVMDALYAVVLIETSMDGECSILMDKVNVTAPFFPDSMENYKLIATTILQKLGLIDILNDEIAAFNNGYEVSVAQTESEEASFIEPDNTNAGDAGENNDRKSDEYNINTTSSLDEQHSKRRKFSKETDDARENSSGLSDEDNINNPSSTHAKHTKERTYVTKSGDGGENSDGPSNDNNINNPSSSGDKRYKRRKFVKENLIGKENSGDLSNSNDTNNAVNLHKKCFKQKTFVKENFINKKPKLLKQTKPEKVNTELNELQMLNLIPSVIDDFDLNVSNYVDINHMNQSSKLEKNNMILKNNEDNNTILIQTQNKNSDVVEDKSYSINTNKSNQVTCASESDDEPNKIETKVLNLQKIESRNDISKKMSSTPEIIITKRSRFASRFSIKPRNLPEESVTNNTTKMNLNVEEQNSSNYSNNNEIKKVETFHLMSEKNTNKVNMETNNETKTAEKSMSVFESDMNYDLDFDL